MSLSREQRALLAQVFKTPDWQKASPRERKALVEAGIVESGLRNLNYGDRDSLGYLQQRPSQGWKNPTSIAQATRSFLSRAKASNTVGGSAGELAQRVQRSAFPARYDQQSGTAAQILKRLGGAQAKSSAAPSVPKPAASSGRAQRFAAYTAYAQNPHLPGASADLALSLLSAQKAQAPSPPPKPSPNAPSGGPAPGAIRGSPTLHGTSVGGTHQTAGLAGYPARDYFAPAGSAAVAPVTGRVFKLSGHDPHLGPVQGAGGPLGWSVYIHGTDGRDYYLTHMGSRTVRVGETVRQGEKIGTVADYHSYGRADHIHMGVHG